MTLAALLIDRRQTLMAMLALGLRPASAAPPPFSRPGAAPSALRKGFNLPDQAPSRESGKADDGILRRLRQQGMTHVRLPIEAEYFLSHFSGAATIDNALADLDRALHRLLDLGFCVSVDMHPGADFQRLQRRDAENAHAALLAGWRGLAARLSHYPADRVFAELLNEPATTDDLWRPFVERLAQDVRTRLPQTTLIVGPAPYQRVEALARWRPLTDKNVVYAAHFYDPMIFTHQGAAWDPGSPFARLTGVPFPFQAGDAVLEKVLNEALARKDEPAARELRQALRTAATAETMRACFAELSAWSQAHAAPVIVNEFGVLRFRAKRADRLAWLAAARVAAEANGFGWAHWDYAGGFGLLDGSGRLDQGVIEALIGPE